MKEVFGKNVLTEIDETASPSHTALVVIDMQNDFGHPDGYFASTGSDVSAYESVVKRIDALVSEARTAGVMVVWIQNEALPGGRSDAPSWLAFKSRVADEPVYTTRDTWGQKFLDPLSPNANEPIITKYRSSAFDSTALDLILRSNDIKTVVLTGCVTEGCVASTARAASFHNYYTEIVEDAVASSREDLRDAALTIMRAYYRVAQTEDYARVWRSSAGR